MERFEWRLTPQYNELENDIVRLFAGTFSKEKEIGKYVYLVNAKHIIGELARSKFEDDRKITKKQFVDKLRAISDRIYLSYLISNKKFDEVKKIVTEFKNKWNIKKDNKEYVLYISDVNSCGLDKKIVELSKKFCYIKNKATFKPIIIIVDYEETQYRNFKEKVYEYLSLQSEIIKINDGYEDYSFNVKLFNVSRFFTSRPSNREPQKFPTCSNLSG
mgnify:CR=1 FL=1